MLHRPDYGKGGIMDVERRLVAELLDLMRQCEHMGLNWGIIYHDAEQLFELLTKKDKLQ